MYYAGNGKTLIAFKNKSDRTKFTNECSQFIEEPVNTDMLGAKDYPQFNAVKHLANYNNSNIFAMNDRVVKDTYWVEFAESVCSK